MGPSCHHYPTIPGQQQCFQLSRSNTTMWRLTCLHGSPLPHTHRPDTSHAGPMVCVWAAPPRHIPSGSRAYQGVNAHVQRPTCAQHTMPERRCAQIADHFAHNSPFSAFFTEVVCVLGATPPQAATSPPPIGGNCTTRGFDTPATRRQQASCSAKPPPPQG